MTKERARRHVDTHAFRYTEAAGHREDENCTEFQLVIDAPSLPGIPSELVPSARPGMELFPAETIESAEVESSNSTFSFK